MRPQATRARRVGRAKLITLAASLQAGMDSASSFHRPSTAVMTLKTTINFAVPESHPCAQPYTFATVVATGKPLLIAPHPVHLTDLRPRMGKIDFDTEGFAAENVPAVLSGEGWEDRYVLTTCEVRPSPRLDARYD